MPLPLVGSGLQTWVSSVCFSVSLLILASSLSVATQTMATPQTAPPVSTQTAPPKPTVSPTLARPIFLRIQDGQFTLGSTPFRSVGVNIPDLFDRFLHGDEIGANKLLNEAHLAGSLFVRCSGIARSPDDFGIFVNDPTRWFAAYDRMLAAADTANIRLVPSLLGNIHLLPDYAARTQGSKEPLAAYLAPGSAANKLAVAYITAITAHYHDDPRILFWEVGDAFNRDVDAVESTLRPAGSPVSTVSTPGSTPTGTVSVSSSISLASTDAIGSTQIRAFLIEIATLLHKRDRRHLVSSGNDDLPPDAWRRAHRYSPAPDISPDPNRDTFAQYQEMLGYLNPPPIDIISVHQTPLTHDSTPLWLLRDEGHAIRIAWVASACRQLNKPLFIGAFGQPFVSEGVEQSAPWTLDFLRRMQAFAAPLACLGTTPDAIKASASAAILANISADISAESVLPSAERTPQLTLALSVANNALQSSVVRELTAAAPDIDIPALQAQQKKDALQRTQLHDIAVGIVEHVRLRAGKTIEGHTNATGVTLTLPDARARYPFFRVRDAALLCGADFVLPDEIEGWTRLLAKAQAGAEGLKLPHDLNVPPYSIPDHITPEGIVRWFSHGDTEGEPEDASFGNLPPADNAFYFIQIVREHLRLTKKPALFQSPVTGLLPGTSVPTTAKPSAQTNAKPAGTVPAPANFSDPIAAANGSSAAPAPSGSTTIADACARAFASIAVDESNGLVACSAEAGQFRVDWGFNDTVRKTGMCLVPSLLRWRAALDLSELYTAAGDRKRGSEYEKEAARIKANLVKVFYQPLPAESGKQVGLLVSATIVGRKDDLWGSAYAVWLGALPADRAEAVARHLLAVYQSGGAVSAGQVRQLPPGSGRGGYWEQTVAEKDTYQNGAFWGLASGWYITALNRVSPKAGAQMLGELLAYNQANSMQGAPYECIDPTRKYLRTPLYAVSIAQPVIALQNSNGGR